jgi:iron complex transport system substrate-binding protein
MGVLTMTACIAPVAAPSAQMEGANAPAAETSTTHIVSTMMGDVETPLSPQRIVALYTYAWAWPIAQLGVDLVGTDNRPEWLEEIKRLDPDSAARLVKAEFIGGDSGPNLEKIATLQPDLIVGGWWNTDIYDKLTQIAPTVLLDYRAETDIIVWQRSLIPLVGATDTSWFEQQAAAYKERVSQLRTAYPDLWPNLQWVRMDTYASDVYVVDLIPFMPGSRVFRDLGATPSKNIGNPQDPQYDGPISLEALPQFDADIIFVAGPNGEPQANILTLLAGTFAGQRNQVFTTRPENWNFCNVQSLHAVLDEIERALQNGPFDTSGDF